MSSEIKTSLEQDSHEGGIRIGKLLLLGFTGLLLIVTSFKTWDFVSLSMPTTWGVFGQIVAVFALVSLDFGTIIWLYLWIKTSATVSQDMLEMAMFIVDGAGVLAANVLDSAIYDKAMQLPLEFEQIGRWVIPAIIVVNALAGIVWHALDATVGVDRELRRQAHLVKRKQRALDLDDEILTQRSRQAAIKQRQAVERQRLAAIEEGIELAEQDTTARKIVAGQIKDGVLNRVRSEPTKQDEIDIKKDDGNPSIRDTLKQALGVGQHNGNGTGGELKN
jgi:hypothetical protein